MSQYDNLRTGKAPPEGNGDTEVPSSWATVDLAAALAGTEIPPPRYLLRNDGVPLLYPGRVHWFQGEAESLKSWAAQRAVAEVLDAGGNALYVDYEDDDRGIVERLRCLGVADEVIADPERFRYVRPDEPLYDSRAAQRHVAELAAHLEHVWALAVIDGVTEAMTVEGLSILDNTDIALFQRRLPKRIAATGAAVICVDHLTKSREGQGRYAIGGQHKLAGVTGAAYKFEATKRLRRALHEPTSGRVTITVEKDRPGWVRARAVGEHETIAVLDVTAYPDHDVRVELLVPDGATLTPSETLIAEILGYLQHYDGASQNRVVENVTGNVPAIRAALRWLVETAGWVSVTKVGQSHRHSLTDDGRKQLEDADEDN